ncbi:hypothetical protein [Bradyrhizobium sp. WD16]|uniref:hypothetical protein n=1 Tax=Bradyrhizobium sp. WD16 TaxID=1521768 RepID=UPI003531EB78
MGFAGRQDGLVAKGLAAAAAKGIVLVAASGNAGSKSPPLFLAADRNVIAVTATDAADKFFAAANRGQGRCLGCGPRRRYAGAGCRRTTRRRPARAERLFLQFSRVPPARWLHLGDPAALRSMTICGQD